MKRTTPNMREIAGSSTRATPALIIREMIDLLPNEDAYCKARLARRADGTPTVTTDLACVRRSLPGAFHCALSFYSGGEHAWIAGFPATVEAILTKAAGRPYDEFDEDPKTTFADIRKVLDKAAGLAS